MRRRGPRPLGLHLVLSSQAAASPDPGGRAAAEAAFVRGIAAYRRHPYRRSLADPPAIWREGDSRLLAYGDAAAPPVLFVPSLVNRAYILDLAQERSMLRYLAAGGVRPLLLDWGWPGREERRFGLTAYVERLERAMAAVPGRLVLAGYCMGGLLALAAALRGPARLAGLALLATPWDFHAPDPDAARMAAASLATLGPVLAGGTLPVDALQAMFAMAGAPAIAARYRAFPGLDPAGERARMFVALEDWLSDGVPLAAPVARECLAGWYGENTPGRGQWCVAGQPVAATALAMPALIALPAQDRIVPPESAAALARHIPHATVLRPAAGHVGMVAGAHARVELWDKLLPWFLAR